MPKSQQFWVPESNPVTNFIVPYFGDKVDSGIGLSYRPAKLHRLAGRYDNPMPESTISPIQELMNVATVFSAPSQWNLRGGVNSTVLVFENKLWGQGTE